MKLSHIEYIFHGRQLYKRFSCPNFICLSFCCVFFLPIQLADVQKAQQSWQIERIYAIIALTAAIAPLIIHQVWDSIGSKRLILMANFLTIIAWVLVMFYRYV